MEEKLGFLQVWSKKNGENLLSDQINGSYRAGFKVSGLTVDKDYLYVAIEKDDNQYEFQDDKKLAFLKIFSKKSDPKSLSDQFNGSCRAGYTVSKMCEDKDNLYICLELKRKKLEQQ